VILNCCRLYEKIIFTVLALVLISCNPFKEERLLDYKAELIELIYKIKKYPHGTYDRDEIDAFIIDNVRDLDIDLIVKNIGKKKSAIFWVC